MSLKAQERSATGWTSQPARNEYRCPEVNGGRKPTPFPHCLAPWALDIVLYANKRSSFAFRSYPESFQRLSRGPWKHPASSIRGSSAYRAQQGLGISVARHSKRCEGQPLLDFFRQGKIRRQIRGSCGRASNRFSTNCRSQLAEPAGLRCRPG